MDKLQRMNYKNTFYQKAKEKLLEEVKEYYENDKKRVRNKYRELSDKEKKIKKRI